MGREATKAAGNPWFEARKKAAILAVHCNCPVIDRESVKATMDEIMEERLSDMRFLLEKNMDAIIKAAKKGRGGYEN